MCDQDQWDIHKLDPFYDCFVPAPPLHPTIRAKLAAASSFPSSSTSSRSSIFADGSQKKSGNMRFMSSTPVMTNPKWRRLEIPTHLARLHGRMCPADAFSTCSWETRTDAQNRTAQLVCERSIECASR
ncbi:hypothetical protein EI94DRAFT_692368 [Lactarius quietus]|nr:hypothetical protein EI94DRAFT_692368 [Lactarius quietus]